MNQRERNQKVVLKIQWSIVLFKMLSRFWNIVVKVLEYGDYDQVTLQDLVSLMQQSLDQVEATEEAYTPHHMKNKLKGHFGDDIYFTEIPGKSDVVVLRRMFLNYCTSFTPLHQELMYHIRLNHSWRPQDSWFSAKLKQCQMQELITLALVMTTWFVSRSNTCHHHFKISWERF